MRWSKKGTIAAIAAMMGVSFAAGALASDGIQKVEAYLRTDFTVLLDGKQVTTDSPLIYNNKAYLPIKSVAELVDVTVNWQDSTKSISINRRYDGQPAAPSETYADYKPITMQYPAGYKVTYLGGEYQMLAIGVDSEEYYRASDLEVMGVDIRALRKYKDRLTSFLFVRKAEVDTLWKQQPTLDMLSGPVVAKESDKEKVDALMDIATRTILEFMDDGYEGFTTTPYVFNIEVKPNGNNEYVLYSLEDNKVFHYYVKLARTNNEDPANFDKVKDDSWYYDPVNQLRRKWSYSSFQRIDPGNDKTDEEISY